MKKIRLSLFIWLLFLGQAVAGDAFVIDHYTIDIQVMPNNVYQVQEHLDVHFNAPRHGLYRTLPLRFGNRWAVVDGVSVKGAPFIQARSGDELTIKIGSEDTTVTGPQVYDISYRYDAGADSRPDMDVFKHNIVGTGWNTDILDVRFDIRMPKDFDAEQVACTAGPLGSTDTKPVTWNVVGRRITGHTLTPLGPHEGLTVVLSLPEGYWKDARSPQPPNAWIWQRFAYPVSALAVILSLLIWFCFGRDKKICPIETLDVPDNMTPAEIGYILNGRVDSRDLAVMPLYWAQKGYLTIEEDPEGEKMTLCRVKKLGKDAKPFEHTMFDTLFELGEDGTVSSGDLKLLSRKTVTRAGEELESFFGDSEDHAVYTANSFLWQLSVTGLSALAFWGVYASATGALFADFWTVVLGLALAAFFITPAIGLGASLNLQSTATNGIRLWRALVMLGVLALYGLVGYVYAGDVPLNVIGAGMGSSLFAALMVAQVSRRTPYGDKIVARVLGFRNHVLRGEGPSAGPSSRYFELLPYAMVMNMNESWASRFKAMAFIVPAWYLGSRIDDFGLFGERMDHTVNTMDGVLDPSDGSGADDGADGGSGGGGGGDW